MIKVLFKQLSQPEKGIFSHACSTYSFHSRVVDDVGLQYELRQSRRSRGVSLFSTTVPHKYKVGYLILWTCADLEHLTLDIYIYRLFQWWPTLQADFNLWLSFLLKYDKYTWVIVKVSIVFFLPQLNILYAGGKKYPNVYIINISSYICLPNSSYCGIGQHVHYFIML